VLNELNIMKKVCILILLILTCFSYLFAPNLNNYQREQKEENIRLIVRLDYLFNYAEFSEENLRELLILLKAPAPEIIINQAKLETGWFKSRLFKYHNNLFGMHYPRIRDTYADMYTIADNGSKCASYASWQSSVLDLLLYIDYYENLGFSTINYYKFLTDVSYCEKDTYVNILKRMT